MAQGRPSEPLSNLECEMERYSATRLAVFVMSKPPTEADIVGAQAPDDADSTRRSLDLNSLAEEAFESPEEAGDWMRSPHPMLDGETPRECAKSNFGAERVKAILLAIRYGGVA